VVPPGIEEPNHLSCTWVDRSYVTSLLPIADYRGVCQIVRGRRTAVLATDDVVDLVGEAGVIFVEEAILASPTCTPSYFGS